jgi:predicted Rossmann-fold nucleotide-binding protein
MKKADRGATDRRRGLYTAEQLLRGFDPEKPMSYLNTWDFKTFTRFVVDGGAAPAWLRVRSAQAKHDSNISDALRSYLFTHTRLVGIMGGHNLLRTDRAYLAVARLAQSLTEKGFLVVTGGGPGAMEAAHLGAAFSNSQGNKFQAALNEVSKVPELPKLDDLLNSKGALKPGREEDVKKAHAWLCAALNGKGLATGKLGASLAIPTWVYGQEPTTPFATSYAKYFQNSIREEALVTNARAGVIYAKGGGGTLREVFEDLEQNYYAPDAVQFTPMIFFDPDQYWERDAEFDEKGRVKTAGIKISDTVRNAIRFARARQGDAALCLEKVRFTTDVEEILGILGRHSPVAESQLTMMLEKAPLTASLATIGIKRSMA